MVEVSLNSSNITYMDVGMGGMTFVTVSYEAVVMLMAWWFLGMVALLFAGMYYTKSLWLGLASVVACVVGIGWLSYAVVPQEFYYAFLGVFVCFASTAVFMMLRGVGGVYEW